MFETGISRKIFGVETEQTRRDLRRLHDKELNTRILYQSENIFSVMRSGKVEWAEHVARIEDEKNL